MEILGKVVVREWIKLLIDFPPQVRVSMVAMAAHSPEEEGSKLSSGVPVAKKLRKRSMNWGQAAWSWGMAAVATIWYWR